MLDTLLADPPQVHTDAVGVVALPTERECYELLAQRCGPGTRTLETGCGLSTAVFASTGADHTCVTPSADEADRLVAWCAARDVSTAGLRFAIGGSAEVLPGLDPTELDVVLIDGGHGFPLPMVDWYYAGGRLRRGGLLVVDDLHLPAVAMLADFLDRDPRWARAAGTPKWAAWERRSEGPLGEEFTAQPFLPPPLTDRQLVRDLLHRRAPALEKVAVAVGRITRRP